MAFTKEQYQDFLSKFIERGYKFRKFEKREFEKFELLLRHDVDFCVLKAREMAEIEADMGVTSTYFFQMNAYFYNIFHEDVNNNITKIRDLGHEISIHFDGERLQTSAENIKFALLTEIGLFERLFETEIQTISLHRPKANGIPYFVSEICCHTYEPEFMEKLAYYSDSRGGWGHGDPLKQIEFSGGDAIQILIHPIWWMNETTLDNVKILKDFLERKKTELSTALVNNVDFIDDSEAF